MLSAPEAYRVDLGARGESFSSADDDWIAVATSVAHATLCPPREQRQLLRKADELARGAFGAEELRRRARAEWGTAPRRYDALVLLALAIQEAGANHVALTIVEGLLALPALTTDLQTARLLAQRAQLTHKLGDHDLAFERYSALDRWGTRDRIAEARARAAMGFATLAQMRGNYPEMLTAARRAYRLGVKSGTPGIERRASLGLMVAAAQLGQHAEALRHAWLMFRDSADDPVAQASSVAVIGQYLFRLGQTRAAYNAFSMVVGRRVPVRVLLLALSGLARAGAQLGGDEAAHATWAIAEVERFDETIAHPYSLASALLESAAALRAMGDNGRADRLRRHGQSIADRHRFHELSLEAEDTALVASEGKGLARHTAEISQHFNERGAARLPAHVQPAGNVLVPA